MGDVPDVSVLCSYSWVPLEQCRCLTVRVGLTRHTHGCAEKHTYRERPESQSRSSGDLSSPRSRPNAGAERTASLEVVHATATSSASCFFSGPQASTESTVNVDSSLWMIGRCQRLCRTVKQRKWNRAYLCIGGRVRLARARSADTTTGANDCMHITESEEIT